MGTRLWREGSDVKVDGPSGRGLWPPVGGRLCSLRSGGDSAYGAEGGGLPLRAMLIKSALRDLLSMSYSMKSILRRHIKLPSEPAHSVGRTHRSVRSTRTIEPGRRRRLNPLAVGNKVCLMSDSLTSPAFGNTAQRTADSRQRTADSRQRIAVTLSH